MRNTYVVQLPCAVVSAHGRSVLCCTHKQVHQIAVPPCEKQLQFLKGKCIHNSKFSCSKGCCAHHTSGWCGSQGLPEGGMRRIILTASGGAFRDWPVEKLASACFVWCCV